jgi:hypothetical protein
MYIFIYVCIDVHALTLNRFLCMYVCVYVCMYVCMTQFIKDGTLAFQSVIKKIISLSLALQRPEYKN